MTMITVVDYGLGNLGSVLNMFRKIGAEARLSEKPEDIDRATALVLPGVGHFDEGMRGLRERKLVEPLGIAVRERKVPMLGICLGMQLFARGSEEGREPGLGWIDADVKKLVFPEGDRRPIPHMGWNDVVATEHTLFRGLERGARFYFVHSYHVVCEQAEDVAATCSYGIDVTAAVRHENLMGTQFHPEKSHRFGMKLLGNFVSSLSPEPASARA